jgi:FHA domain/Transcriptional regulatory protein, C terminal
MAERLSVQLPGGQQHDFPLTKAVTTIGRSPECDLVLDYAYVSRLHTKIEKSRNGWTVIDCGSINGTVVNGRRISEAQVLAPEDDIALGDIRLTFAASMQGGASTAFFRPSPADSPIRCDSSSWQVWIGDGLLETRLSLQEFGLLSLLSSRFGRICTRDELGTALWGRGKYDFNLLHRLVHRLKEKLGPEYSAWILSVPGLGYKLIGPETE